MRKALSALLGALVVGSLLVAVPAAEAEFVYGDGWFRATCKLSHRANNDPIIYPGQEGASHSHEFYGSTATNADTTTKQLKDSTTTCNPGPDKSAYWVPSLYESGKRVKVAKATFYYAADTNWTGDDLTPYPRGLRVIAGTAGATGGYDGAPYEWSCAGSPSSASQTEFPQCDSGRKLVLHLDFPECWDGEHKDSADHKSHMTYRLTTDENTQVCPESHPVPVPRLQFEYRYKTDGGPDTTLASLVDGQYAKTGGPWTAHGDFWNAWDTKTLKDRVGFCLVAHTMKCDEKGHPLSEPEAAPVVDVAVVQPDDVPARATSAQRSRTTAFCRHDAVA
jgi:Domain of unknown function (DUF1996)